MAGGTGYFLINKNKIDENITVSLIADIEKLNNKCEVVGVPAKSLKFRKD